ncbi:MFS transporter [Homoserinibacter sp. GY 40078]|uniref:MFS transporter n=1 Tax=Homoserinibacter sp. GY 40078 TaxID=2603275 RepID=UPI0011CCCE6B|nr:MFS transporter [Homoserinibacter sp. GY 40078]TXK19023.1 MFS transporter [Homoserinibacter sp. GY 40078]
MSQTFRSFATRNYRLWFAGAFVSNIGTWMQRIAQDWLVLVELTDEDAIAVGVVMALQFGPQLVLLPVTGWVADRFDRRRVLAVTQGVMLLLALGLGLVTLLGVAELWMVFGFALGLGVTAAFDAPARQAFVGELVDGRLLANAVALNAASFNGARLIGPAVAGILVAAVGSGWVFIINAGTFVAMLAALAALHTSDLTPFTRKARGPGQLRAGFRYVRRRPDILLVFTMVFLTGTLGYNFPIYTATMARVEFGEGPEEFGWLSSALAVGSVAGALLAARRDRPRLRTLTLASAGFGLSLAAAALAPEQLSFGVLLTLVGFAGITMMNTANAYVQTTTSPSMRGRVMALYLGIFLGGTPIGAPLVGAVADAAGPRWAIAVGAASGLLAAGIAGVFYVRTREVRLRWDRGRAWPLRLDRPTPADRDTATREIAIVEATTQR